MSSGPDPRADRPADARRPDERSSTASGFLGELGRVRTGAAPRRPARRPRCGDRLRPGAGARRHRRPRGGPGRRRGGVRPPPRRHRALRRGLRPVLARARLDASPTAARPAPAIDRGRAEAEDADDARPAPSEERRTPTAEAASRPGPARTTDDGRASSTTADRHRATPTARASGSGTGSSTG